MLTTRIAVGVSRMDVRYSQILNRNRQKVVGSKENRSAEWVRRRVSMRVPQITDGKLAESCQEAEEGDL